MTCTDRFPIRSQSEVLEVRTPSGLLEGQGSAHKGGTQWATGPTASQVTLLGAWVLGLDKPALGSTGVQ